MTLPVDPVALSVAGAGGAYVIADGRVREGGGGRGPAPLTPAPASPSWPGSP
jgi:hypothetical protein